MLDYGIFYEFVPMSRMGDPAPPRLTVSEVESGVPYAIYLTTNSGLWSYALGDVVKFISLDPPRLLILGRTTQFVNAFGENVIVEELEGAIASACEKATAEIVDFTVDPQYSSIDNPVPRHEWVVEFRRHPSSLALFSGLLDEYLQRRNTDYRTHRQRDLAMAPPLVTAVPPGTFQEWLRGRGKLGGQHKVPRVANSRGILGEVLTLSERLKATVEVGDAHHQKR